MERLTQETEATKQILKHFLGESELFTLHAQMLKKTYDALVRAGFTPKQAIQIVAHQGSAVQTK
jgi:hypothetical protein